MAKIPIFVRSGAFFLANAASTFRYAGHGSAWWSSRTSPTSATLAYWFEINNTGSRPSWGPYDRWYGYSLRCLSTVLGM